MRLNIFLSTFVQSRQIKMASSFDLLFPLFCCLSFYLSFFIKFDKGTIQHLHYLSFFYFVFSVSVSVSCHLTCTQSEHPKPFRFCFCFCFCFQGQIRKMKKKSILERNKFCEQTSKCLIEK